MPKNKKTKPKIKEKKSETEIKEIKSDVEIKETSRLMRDVVQMDEGNAGFRKFMGGSERFVAPVLDKIASAPTQSDLEQGITTSPNKINNEDIAAMDYVSGQSDATERLLKYVSDSEVPRLKPSDVSRGARRVQFIDPLEGMGITHNSMDPEIMNVGIRERKTGDPLEENKKKYKDVRFGGNVV